MTRDDIIRMGFEADLCLNGVEGFVVWLMPSEEKFLKFAALVVAAEREACAKVCEELPNTFKIAADEFGYTAEQPTAENYVAAIRARSDE